MQIVFASSNSIAFNPRLHSIRGLAAFAVLLFHWEQFFPAGGIWLQQFVLAESLIDPTVYIGFGWLGVPLFFILSGWLLGGQVIQARMSFRYLGRFWGRRFLRIYPAVWAELIVLLLIASLIPGLVGQASYDTLLLQFLLWLNLPPFMATPLNLVWWTLPVELSFYLLLPFIGWLARKVSWQVLLFVSLVITMSWRYWIFSTAAVDNYLVVLPVLDSLVGTLFTFMLGFSLNFLPLNFEERRQKWGLIMGLIFLLALIHWQIQLDAVYWTGHWILVVWPPMVALAIAVVVFHLRHPMPLMGWLSSPVLVWLGHVSFGVYLWHFQVMRAMALLFPEYWSTPSASVLALVIATPATLFLASLSYYLVERPLMGWGKKKLSGG